MSENLPWERQPWDSDKSYAAFHTYYLSIEPADRTLPEAYRRYRQAQGVTKATSPVPGVWHLWAYATDREGKRPPGSVYENALTWLKRAQAYDDHLYRQEQAVWAARRQKLKEAEWGIGDKLIVRAERMLTAGLFERIHTDPTGPVILKPTNWTEVDIGRTYDLALKLQRRAAGLEQGTISLEVDWKRQLAAAGVDPGDLFEKMVNELVNRPGSESSDA